MKSFILLLFFTFFIPFAWSQSIGHVEEVTIQNSFDKVTIQIYAGQAELKVEELFEYLKAALNTDNTADLNEQLKSNMTQLFIQEDEIQLTGIESKTNYTTATNWIDDWKKTNVKIVSMERIDSELKSSYWIYKYRLVYQINGKQKEKKMTVQVYFKPQSKAFGKTRRTVWDLKIGSVIFQ